MSHWRRLTSAIPRRVRWLRSLCTGDRPTPAEAAFAWLFGPETVDGVPAAVGDRSPSRQATRAAIAVAADYGMETRCDVWQARLPACEETTDPSSAGPDRAAQLAQEAIAGYCRGDRHAADRIMARLARRQTPEGVFPKRWGWLGPSREQSGLAVVDYLAAARLQVAAAFQAPSPDTPDQIDPDDGRVQAVLRWAGALSPDAKLADVGCGPGRFLRHLRKAWPAMRLFGIDPSAALLSHLPSGVEARRGDLLRIPAADAEFDAALAVESLEHALVPAQAVAQLCRVVRPGGHVLIIDKNRRHQALSEHEPWERWFRPRELADWLAPFCEEVRVEPVAHGEGRPPDLFIVAAGRRKSD